MSTIARAVVIICSMALTACIPRIEVAPPKEPVTINMHVKIDHEIHIKADDQLKTLLERESDLLTPAGSRQQGQGIPTPKG